MQAMDLLKLHHSNICTYKELFVTWNNQVRMEQDWLCVVYALMGISVQF